MPAKGEVARAGTPPAWSTRQIALLALALAGLLLTGYLTLVAWRGGAVALCSEGSSCDLLQGSAWSRFPGVPVALWGFVLHALLAWTAWRRDMPRLARWRWRLSFWEGGDQHLPERGWVAVLALRGRCLLPLALVAAIFMLVDAARSGSAPGPAGAVGCWPMACRPQRWWYRCTFRPPDGGSVPATCGGMAWPSTSSKSG